MSPNLDQVHCNRGSVEQCELYITWDYTDKWHGKANLHPQEAFPVLVRGCMSKRRGVNIPKGSWLTIPQTWYVTCGHGAVTPPKKLGFIDLWSVVGFIASRSDGWFVCLLIGQLEVWMVSSWLSYWFVRYLVCWSVGRTIRLAFYPTNHRLTGYPYIHLSDRWPTNQRQFLYYNKRSVFEFSVSGFNVSPFPSGWLAAVGLPDPCLQVTGQVWGVFQLVSMGIYPSPSWRTLPDRSRNTL